MNNDIDAFCMGCVDGYGVGAEYGCESVDLAVFWKEDLDTNGRTIPNTMLSEVCPASCGMCERNVSDVEYWVKVRKVTFDDLTLYSVMMVVRDVAMAAIDKATAKVQSDIDTAIVAVNRDIAASMEEVQ
eukprot:gene5749-1340_t